MLKEAVNSTVDLYMYEYPLLPDWVLENAFENNLIINVHMAGYTYQINPDDIDEENIKVMNSTCRWILTIMLINIVIISWV